MSLYTMKTVSIIYHCQLTQQLKSHEGQFMQKINGRVFIPQRFKKHKAILAVCEGPITLLNKVGERAMTDKNFHIVS